MKPKKRNHPQARWSSASYGLTFDIPLKLERYQAIPGRVVSRQAGELWGCLYSFQIYTEQIEDKCNITNTHQVAFVNITIPKKKKSNENSTLGQTLLLTRVSENIFDPWKVNSATDGLIIKFHGYSITNSPLYPSGPSPIFAPIRVL